jgi:hypothetical protein
VQTLTCMLCGAVFNPEDDFEAGLFAAWHLSDAHENERARGVCVTYIEPSGDTPAQRFLEVGRQVVQ